MSRVILAGMDDFKKVRVGNSLYVDKSDFISELLDTGSVVVAIARPRRFGKSLNMSMLSYFFDVNDKEENRKLFKGLKIEKSPYFAKQGQYPVINLTFKNFKAMNFQDCYNKIVKLVVTEYDKHPYLKDSPKLTDIEKKNYNKILNREGNGSDYESSLGDLSKYLYKHHGREVVILVDEFDTPAIEGELKGYYEEVSNFMQAFLGEALKGNDKIFKGVVTGITRLQGAGIFSGVNNADIFTILDKEFKDKFGFTEKEVKELLKEYEIEEKEEEVRELYNGYNFRGEVIYNPYSVVKYIKKGEFGNFWLGSSDNDIARKKVKHLFKIKGDEVLRKEVEDLLQGKKIRLEIDEAMKISKKMGSSDIFNLLLYSGYLKYENYVEKAGDVGYVDVSIPNLEIKSIYKKTINEWVKEEYSKEEIKELKNFLDSVCEGGEKEIKERLEKYLNRRSLFDVEKVEEMGYHNFLFGLLQGLEGSYLLDSNKESGGGRFDIMLTPTKEKEHGNESRSGVIIELKVGEKDRLKSRSEEALKQIEGKRYHKNLEDQGVKKVRLIGIAFNKKEAEVSLKEMDLDKK